MDYNSNRKRLILPEYGRNIHKMVDFALTVEDREERDRVARSIIAIMGNMYPHLRDVSDFRHKLWDHLAIMSDFKLDITSPYELPTQEKLSEKPESIPYSTNRIRYRHYGKTIEALIEKAIAMEDPTEKKMLVGLIANHMKKSFITWNKDSVADDKIFMDILELSGGLLKVEEGFKLQEAREPQFTPKNKKKKFKRDDRKYKNR